MFPEIKRSVIATVLFAAICCGVYPALVWAMAQATMPGRANGSLIQVGSRVIGSSLIGQQATGEAHFHPRPSAAGSGYDAAASSGSNLGPISQTFLDQVRTRVIDYRRENGLAEAQSVPADAVTASGSGLDPHISVANAELQVPRVARALGMPEGEVRRVVDAHTEGRDLGLLGEPRVNVLELNLALDRLRR